jgi:DNA (cytosine-5)-methyltransferase 1
VGEARAYYNEFDPFAAQWLRNLIDAGLIPSGDVDERSIVDVRSADLAGYAQCHFFAGIGGWPHALRLAGWPDDRPVWTGSCPCQPLSGAGLRKGHADERHLWPAFHDLIAERQPATVFGEQVANKDGREWYAAVQADLEAVGYACGAADLCSPGVGLEWQETSPAQWLDWAILHCPDPNLASEMRHFADWAGREIVASAPNIRQRLYWVADAASAGSFPSAQPRVCGGQEGSRPRHGESERRDAVGRLANATGSGQLGRRASQARDGAGSPRVESERFRDAGGLADADRRQRDGVAGGQGFPPARQATGWDQGDGQPERCGEIDGLEHADRQGRDAGQLAAQADGHRGAAGPDGGAERVADAASARLEKQRLQPGDDGQQQPTAERAGQAVGWLADMPGERREWGADTAGEAGRRRPEDGGAVGGRPGARHGGWGNADWLFCTDAVWRPVAPRTFPLASGIPHRVALLRGAGNAINPALAAQFIQAFSEILTTE